MFRLSPPLKIGTVRLVFNASGKIPFSRLSLKICASGTEIAEEIFFRSFVLIPSMSALVLLIRVWIISCTCSGPVSPRSSNGTLLIKVWYEDGRRSVGVTELKISIPTFVKNVLKFSEISLGSVMASLFTLISVIPPLPALPNATSFKSDQVFLEFFSCLWKAES